MWYLFRRGAHVKVKRGDKVVRWKWKRYASINPTGSYKTRQAAVEACKGKPLFPVFLTLREARELRDQL